MKEHEFRKIMEAFETFLETLQDAEMLSAKGEDFRHKLWERYVKSDV